MYKESYYNFKKEAQNGELAIYNSKTGAIFIIDKTEKNDIINMLDQPSLADAKDERFLTLNENGFIINEDEDEFNTIKDWHERYINLNNILHFTVLPAEKCNFACPYCFNYEDRNLMMKEEVYEGMYNRILKFINDGKNEEQLVLRITWFGGEPTLDSKNIETFMRKVSNLTRDHHNLVVQSDIVTNGYLLNEEIA